MLAVELIALVLWGVVLELERLPALYCMAGLAGLVLELPLVLVLVAV
ncbi:MAG: hypothetical protein HZB83_00445 [Deltaproteobacteria bacterium]|nr:hypothetical protein [Deltaproteobacteria bacterium]